MKFLAFACIAAFMQASVALRFSKSHQDEEASAEVGQPAPIESIQDQVDELKALLPTFADEAQESFHAIDANADGSISREEFDNFSKDVTEEERNKNWANFDLNGDDSVSSAQFKATFKKKTKQAIKNEIKKINEADTDGDGALSPEEIAAVPGGVATVNVEEAPAQ